jgi:hypothetical protein
MRSRSDPVGGEIKAGIMRTHNRKCLSRFKAYMAMSSEGSSGEGSLNRLSVYSEENRSVKGRVVPEVVLVSSFPENPETVLSRL